MPEIVYMYVCVYNNKKTGHQKDTESGSILLLGSPSLRRVWCQKVIYISREWTFLPVCTQQWFQQVTLQCRGLECPTQACTVSVISSSVPPWYTNGPVICPSTGCNAWRHTELGWCFHRMLLMPLISLKQPHIAAVMYSGSLLYWARFFRSLTRSDQPG